MANIFKELWDGVRLKGDNPLGGIGQPAINSSFQPFHDFFNWILGKQTLTRFVKAYGRNPFVSQIINKIAFNVASIDRIAVDKDGKKVDNSKILELLAEPNEDQSQVEFYEVLGQYYEATGNTYIHHIKGVGAGDELKVLEADKVEIKCDTLGNVIRYDWKRPDGKTQKIPAEEVLHIHEGNIVNTEGVNAKYGLSKLHAAMIVVVSSDEKFKAEASIFKNKGIAGFITTATNTPMLEDERERMQEVLDKEIGGSDKFNKLQVSTSDLKFLQTGMSPTDLKLLEGLVSSLRILCSTYGLSSVIFNDTANSTYNNVQEAVKSAYFDVYIPTAQKFDHKISKFLSKRLSVNETIVPDITSIEAVKATTNELLQSLNNVPTPVLPRVISNMTQEEIRSIIPSLGALAEGEEVIGDSKQINLRTDEETT